MRLGAAFLLAVVACARPHPSSDDASGDAQAPADAGPTRIHVKDVTMPVDEAPPATFVGARRAHLVKLDDEPGLAKNAEVIRTHFDGGLPSSMDFQAVPLASGKQGLLLGAAASDPNPIALLVDAEGTALWIKKRPLGGITPPARPFAMAPRPDGGLALFVYDEPTKLVAARMWAADGAAYAEIMLFALARCDAISAAWWPGRGWIVVTSFPGGARAQLVTEDGGSAWGSEGMPVGEAWRAAAPATIVIEPETWSWMLFQHATRRGADHVIAIRYGAQGERIKNDAQDFGAVPTVAHTLDRVDASVVGGLARVNPR